MAAWKVKSSLEVGTGKGGNRKEQLPLFKLFVSKVPTYNLFDFSSDLHKCDHGFQPDQCR